MRDVFFLTSGVLNSPAFVMRPTRGTSRFSSMVLSLTVGVSVGSGGDVVLVDAGWSDRVCADPQGALGRVQSTLLGVDALPGESIVSQLKRLGIAPGQVKSVVATHLHLDHIGGIEDFPNAEVITTFDELTAYRALGRRGGYREGDLERAGRVRLATLDAGPSMGFHASADLLGDGSLTLLSAPGHTRGNLAVAMKGAEGVYVHVGDAVFQRWEYAALGGGPCLWARVTAYDAKEMRRTYGSLRACEALPERPIIVPSHDIDVFDTLPHRPRSMAWNGASVAV